MNAIETIFVPIASACDVLGIGKTTFYKLARSGQIKIVKLGKKSLVRVDSLRVLADELCKETADAA